MASGAPRTSSLLPAESTSVAVCSSISFVLSMLLCSCLMSSNIVVVHVGLLGLSASCESCDESIYLISSAVSFVGTYFVRLRLICLDMSDCCLISVHYIIMVAFLLSTNGRRSTFMFHV